MEIVAPAGDRTMLEAAVEAGADAVYLGYAIGTRGYALAISMKRAWRQPVGGVVLAAFACI